MKHHSYLFIVLILFFLLVNVTMARASEENIDESGNGEVFLEKSTETFFIDDATIVKGITLPVFDSSIMLAIPPKALKRSTHIAFTLDSVHQETLPKNRDNDSGNLILSLQEEDAGLSKDATLVFQITDNTYMPIIARWDESRGRWRDQPTKLRWKDQEVTTTTRSLRGQYALQYDTSRHWRGKATWYPDRLSKDSRFAAASNEYPLRTKLNVTNIQTHESVVVQVQSVGPFVKGRIIDLTKTAFSKIGYPRKQGVLDVIVEPVDKK